ncbi:MAG: hypothetical protein AB7F88_16070 [Pyrinomonadaceae bacterium]
MRRATRCWNQKGKERKDHWVVSDPDAAEDVVARIAEAEMACVKLPTYKDEAIYLAVAAAKARLQL